MDRRQVLQAAAALPALALPGCYTAWAEADWLVSEYRALMSDPAFLDWQVTALTQGEDTADARQPEIAARLRQVREVGDRHPETRGRLIAEYVRGMGSA